MKDKYRSGKAGDHKTKTFGMTTMAIVVAVMFILVYSAPKPVFVQDDEGSWNVLWEISSASAAEADPGGFASGWLSTFCLDYAETPVDTVGNSNATTGLYDVWGNVSGYQNTDDAEAMDLASEDPFYFVVRCRLNETNVGSGGTLMSNRCRVSLTVSGDETISNVEIFGHDTNIADGGAAYVVVNNSNWLYVNFVWDDGVDGYRIIDDGSLAWNITISAKF